MGMTWSSALPVRMTFLRIPPEPHRGRLTCQIAQGYDPVKARFLHDGDAVQPQDDLHQGKDIVQGNRGNGSEGHASLHLRVYHVVDLEHITEYGLNHRKDVGVIEVEAELPSSCRRPGNLQTDLSAPFCLPGAREPAARKAAPGERLA